MKEDEAIRILKNRKEYYNMHHTGYDRVIKYLERREIRKQKSSDIAEREKRLVNDFNDLIDSLDTLRITIFNRCSLFLESIAELEARIEEYRES